MASRKYIDLKENDYAEFYLYPSLPCTNTIEPESSLDIIRDFRNEVCKIVHEISGNYIWHNEEFQVTPKNLLPLHHSDLDSSEAFSLCGSINYAENIEDEWFLVYILIYLTKKIKDLVVRVKDTDGEFLLIEAAEHLPSWITPENSEDKVFIYRGHLQILPKSFKSGKDGFVISQSVINYVRQNTDQTRVTAKVQQAIEKRIAGYPGKIEENFHKINLYVPVAIAALLNVKPKLVAPAVRAFYERDLIDIKACQAMKYFPPENCVWSQIKFTKCLYAMLATSKYLPDKRTGWNLPHPNEDNYKSYLLGIKVACGFEILLSHGKGKPGFKDEDLEKSAFNNDPNWDKFLISLKGKNYFRGLLEYSNEYNRLLEAAQKFYKESFENSVKPDKSKEICAAFEGLEVDLDDLKKRERYLPESDNDDWMNITQENLEAMLEARFGRASQVDKDVVDGSLEIADHLRKFMNHVSGLEGAEFPDFCKKEEKSPGRPKRGLKTKKNKTVKFSPDTKLHSSTSEEKIQSARSNRIQLEPDGFINAIQNILDFSIPDDNYWDSDGSGMSSYEDESDLDMDNAGMKSSGKKDKRLVKYMEKMDKELYQTTIGQSFVTKESEVGLENDESFDEVENFKPVDVDKNAFKNMISSYQAQLGKAGPAENILGPLGVNLEDLDADVD